MKTGHEITILVEELETRLRAHWDGIGNLQQRAEARGAWSYVKRELVLAIGEMEAWEKRFKDGRDLDVYVQAKREEKKSLQWHIERQRKELKNYEKETRAERARLLKARRQAKKWGLVPKERRLVRLDRIEKCLSDARQQLDALREAVT